MSFSSLAVTVSLLSNRPGENQSARYYRYAFEVPQGCGELTVAMDIFSVKSAQIPMILFDSQGDVRLMRAANATIGNAHTQYTITPAAADKGCIPGPLPAGEWKLLLYKRRILEDVEATLHVSFMPAAAMPAETQTENVLVRELRERPFSEGCFNPAPGWYCGELHTHSDASTGYTSAAEVIAAARAQHIDFLAMTDHFTAAHWLELQRLRSETPPLLLRSMEVSGDFGHANVHGLESWLNPLVDDNAELAAFLGLPERPTMEAIADAAHRQGALFGVNHALSGIMGWRYRDFPMEKADLYEVFCTAEMQTSILYPTHWDMFLTRGLHLTGVGSSDSHHPTNEGPWKLGHVRTWVYADSLSQADILKALKRGRVYVGIEGVRMDMKAEAAGRTAYMGDTLALDGGQTARVTLELTGHPRGNLFIYADGMVLDTIYYDHAGDDRYEFDLSEGWIQKSGTSYVRIEFHEMAAPPPFYGVAFRDHESARLISNPIWLTRKEANVC